MRRLSVICLITQQQSLSSTAVVIRPSARSVVCGRCKAPSLSLSTSPSRCQHLEGSELGADCHVRPRMAMCTARPSRTGGRGSCTTGSADETGGRFAVGSRAAAQAQSWRKRNIEPDCSSEWHMLALRLSDRPQPPAAASRNLTASTGTPESL